MRRYRFERCNVEHAAFLRDLPLFQIIYIEVDAKLFKRLYMQVGVVARPEPTRGVGSPRPAGLFYRQTAIDLR